jgi:hypothetical protein
MVGPFSESLTSYMHMHVLGRRLILIFTKATRRQNDTLPSPSNAEMCFEDQLSPISDPMTKGEWFSAALQLQGRVSMTSASTPLERKSLTGLD